MADDKASGVSIGNARFANANKLYQTDSKEPGNMANDEAVAVSSSNGLFANKLYQILAEKPGNIFFSPISAHAILSLAYQGAANETAESFKTALNIPSTEPTAKGYKEIMTSLNSVKNVTLHIANKVFVHQNYKLKDSFKSAATEYFLSEAENVNFAEDTAAANQINCWVEKKTKNKIKDLISPQNLDESTCLVLVNAIYFKGTWDKKFKPRFTHNKPFWISATESVNCQMMHLKEYFNYAESDELDARIVKLPYTNRDLSFVIILPNSRDGINNLEVALAGVDLTTLTDQGVRARVGLSLPKFKMETTIPLKGPLMQLGLERIFSDDAEFPNMIESSEPLKISEVIQKAFIDVNEEGAEAAAATRLMVTRYSDDGIQMVTDHPFIFFLQSSFGQGQNILFYGRMSNPS